MEILSAQWGAVYLGLLRHLFSEICQHFIRGRGGESAPTLRLEMRHAR